MVIPKCLRKIGSSTPPPDADTKIHGWMLKSFI